MSMVHIIGAGLAGLSAAVALAHCGLRVSLYEAAAHAGGRCRSYHDPLLDIEIDNGNHLLLGANSHALKFLETMGARHYWQPAGPAYEFIDIKHGTRWQLKPPYWLPALPLAAYLPLLRLLFASNTQTLTDIISPKSALFQRFIAPISISMLNTPPDAASARLFANTLLSILRRGKHGAQPIIAAVPFQQAIIAPALDYLRQYQVDIYYRKRLSVMEHHETHITKLIFADDTMNLGADDTVILATPAQVTEKLLPTLKVPNAYESIINGHFVYELTDKKHQIIGLTNATVEWIFIKENIISTTTSAANRYHEYAQGELASLLWRDVQTALHISDELPAHRIVTEKRATFVASPEQLKRRPATQTPWQNLFLAGDYTDTGLPATIEGSIRSGERAAQMILADKA